MFIHATVHASVIINGGPKFDKFFRLFLLNIRFKRTFLTNHNRKYKDAYKK